MLSSLLLVAAPLASAPVVPPSSIPAPIVRSAGVDDYKKLLKDAGKDPEKLWSLYEWSLEDEERKKYRKRILNKIVKVAPDHRQAREALGHVEFEGKWFKTERERDKYVSKIAEERGYVKYDGKWVDPADVAYLERGWEKDEYGNWFDPVAKKRLAEGWKQQDLVWVEPGEVENIDKGLWKCGDKWLPLEQADDWHAEYDSPWVIPTTRAVIWSTANRETAMKAAKEAENAYFDMRKVFGFGGEVSVPFMLLRNQTDYLQFMDGSEDYDLPQLDPLAMSAFNRASFADLWFDFDEEAYRGMGVTYWDADDPNGDLFGKYDARFAYGLSFVESIDPTPQAADDVLREGEVSPEFAQVRIEDQKLPRWFRWGAACYASRWFVDNTIKKGGDPYYARAWSASNLNKEGGLLSFDDVFEFEASGGNENTYRMILQAGLLVAFLVDGKDPELSRLLGDLQKAIEKREDTRKIFSSIRNALDSKEEQIIAFMNQ
ncbi:MAG: hypothetical protein AAF957_02735 [Planctomycetota bacterium]